MIVRSHFITDNRIPNFIAACGTAGIFKNKSVKEALATGDWDEKMEGLYIKWEEDHVVKGRYKFVRESFTNSILEQDTHWHDRPIVQNKLKEGSFENMFK
jgi:hypothetical protein